MRGKGRARRDEVSGKRSEDEYSMMGHTWLGSSIGSSSSESSGCCWSSSDERRSRGGNFRQRLGEELGQALGDH
jgi:hypothetical protein